jgi:hypothetical protein
MSTETITSNTPAPTSSVSFWDTYFGGSASDAPFDWDAPVQIPEYNLDPANENSFINQLGLSYEELVEVGFYTGNGTEEAPVLPSPGNVSPETFYSWHKQLQLSYIFINSVVSFDGTNPPTDGYRFQINGGVVTIGSGSDKIDVFISGLISNVYGASPGTWLFEVSPINSQNSLEIIILNNLTVENFSTIEKDGLRILDEKIANYASSLGLFTRDVLLANENNPAVKLQKLQVNFYNSDLTFYLRNLSDNNLQGGEIAEDALTALKKQIDLLITSASIFYINIEYVNTMAEELLNRVDELNNYAKSLSSILISLPSSPPVYDPTSLDHYPGSINAASPEDQIANLITSFGNLTGAVTAMSLCEEISVRIAEGTATDLLGKPLDGPGLVSAYIYNLSIKIQSRNQYDTELFNQLNTLIKSYGVMQRLINETLDKFVSSSNDDLRVLGGSLHQNQTELVNIDEINLTPEERAAISMFMPRFTGSDFVKNPIEGEQGVDRPEIYIGNRTNNAGFFIPLDRQQWTTMLQELNDAVTLLNQNSQIQFNEITTTSQRRTVFFEAASDALVKLNDILTSMARNTV